MTDSLPHLHLLGVGVVFNEDIAWLEISVDNVLFSERLHTLGWREREREREGEKDTDRQRQRGRERETDRENVCIVITRK